MKRLSAILIFVAFVAVASAQEPIRYGDSCYWFFPCNDTGYFLPESGVHNWLYVPDSVVPIFGIAATIREVYLNDTAVKYNVRLFERMNKYDLGYRFWLIDSKTAPRGDRIRYYEYSANVSGAMGFPPNPFSEIVESDEFYFDSVHYVNDSIVIVAVPVYGSTTTAGGGMVYGAGYRSCSQPELICHGDFYSRDWFRITDSYSEIDTCTCYPFRLANWGGIFPIIGLRCDTAVRNLHAVPSEGLVAWDNDESALYQVAVGMYNKPPDSAFLVLTTADTAVVLDSLPHGEYYGVWVRRQCHYVMATYDTVVWSPWGNRMLVYMPLAIEAAASSVHFTLSPNPASGTVRLACGETVLAVEVTDLAGRRVLARQRPNDGLLDIRTLPAGIYTVHVTTSSGVGIQQLVVE